MSSRRYLPTYLGFARCVQYLRPHAPSDPPRIPAPPTSPQTRLKKTVQASVSQSTTSHSPRAKKLQTPVQSRIRTPAPPPPPPPRPFPALLSTHAHVHHKNAINHHKPIRPQLFGRPQSAPRPLSLSHPHAPRHATVKHAYLSPLGPPLLGAQVRLPLPPPTPSPPGTTEIFSAHPATFCFLLLTPFSSLPLPEPPPSPTGKISVHLTLPSEQPCTYFNMLL